MNPEDNSMRRAIRVQVPILALLVVAAMRAAATPAPAAARPTEQPADVYRRECGDCHVAYPARLLPATDWQRIVAALDRHFGVDASLDPATTRTVAAWLAAGAGRAGSTARRSSGEREMRGVEGEEREEEEEGEGRRGESPARVAPGPTGAARATEAALPRITSRDWFRREHGEVSAATWQRASIRSASNCEACHTDAAQGRFSERALRIPR